MNASFWKKKLKQPAKRRIEMQQNSNVEQQYRTMTIIWAALLNSQILFLVMLYFIKPGIFSFDFTKPLLDERYSVVILALAFVGISTFLMSFVLKSKFLKQAIETQKTAPVQTAMIIACALCESTTLFGLVLAFAFDYQYFFLWFALGILGIILHFPRRDQLAAASYKKL
jgi:F0F1-type ATP synthase membrane subunit c/vacuolar-type H+-ATPase subunit K